jgi:hypothetical protein
MQYRPKYLYFNSLNPMIMNHFGDQRSLNKKNLTVINSYVLKSPATIKTKNIVAMAANHSYSRMASPKREKALFRSAMQSGFSAPRDLKWKPTLNQVLDQPRKVKTKCKKFPTFLQFLLYQDLYSSRNQFSSKEQSGLHLEGKNTVFGYSALQIPPGDKTHMNSVYLPKKVNNNNLFITGKNKNILNRLVISELDSNLANNFSHTNRKWSSFFPYKKSFLCYWLLPVMGFVSYVSTQEIRQGFVFEKQTGNLGWSINFKSPSMVSTLRVGPLKQFNSNFANEDFLTLQKNEENKTTISTNKVFLFSSNFKLTFKEYWYKTSLIYNSLRGEIKGSNGPAFISCLENNRSSEHTKIYPDKFYNTPFSSIPFTSSVHTKESVNPKSLYLKQNIKKVTSAVFGFKNLVLNKIEKTKVLLQKDTLGKAQFVSASPKGVQLINFNSTVNLTTHSGEKNYLLGISSTLPLADPNIESCSTSLKTGARKNLINNWNNSYFFPTLSPVFSYKKALFLMDEYSKALIVSGSPLHRTPLKMPMGHYKVKVDNKNNNNNLIENIKTGMKLLPFIVEREKAQNTSALDLYKDSRKFPKTVSLTASSGNSTKLSVLEQIISFLQGIKSNKNLGLTENTSPKSAVITKKEFSPLSQHQGSQDESIFYNTPSTVGSNSSLVPPTFPIRDWEGTSVGRAHTLNGGTENHSVKKLTKDQLYFIILNSNTKGVALPTYNKVLKLNHPLLFSSTPHLGITKPTLKLSNSNTNKYFSKLADFSLSTKLDTNTPFSSPLAGTSHFNKNFFETKLNNEAFNPQSLKGVSADEKSKTVPPLKDNSMQSSRTKYVNYLSLRFKQILTPFYSSFLVKEKGLNLLNEKRIEKIFRSYLSKKRKSLKKVSASYLSKPKGLSAFTIPSFKGGQVNTFFKKTLVQKKVSLLAVKEKTQILLGRNKNQKDKQANKSTTFPIRDWEGTSVGRAHTLSSVKVYTINSLFKNRVFLLKKTKPDNIFISDTYNLNSINTFSKVGLSTNLVNPALVDKLEKEEHNINKSYFNLPNQRLGRHKCGQSPHFEKLEKHKYAQKKHRRKKQRKETRRRKKRKRFYPRPIWSRNKMYQNILLKLSSKSQWNTGTMQKGYYSKKNESFNLNSLVKKLPLYSTKDFYQIKRSVLGELKRAFWKSYWLRSNLNPYLNEIKTNLKEIEKASTKETLYYNLRNLIMSVSGLSQIPEGIKMTSLTMGETKHNTNLKSGLNLTVNLHADMETAQSRSESGKGTLNLPIREKKGNYQLGTGFPNFYTNLYFLNKQSLSGIPSKLNFNTSLNDLTGSKNILSTQNKWQLMTQIAEHNRIMYERIQNLILNIRENLTLSGQFKARAYKRTGRLKFKSLSTLKQVNPNNPQTNPDFWSKLGKTTASIFSQSSIKYYGDLSTNRLSWAMHKTNLGSFKSINRIKSIWANTKNRDQSKANKTKKIFYDIHKKYASFLNYSFIKGKFDLDNGLWVNKASTGLDSRAAEAAPVSVFKLGNPFSNELKSALLVSQRKIRHKEQKLLSLGLNKKQLGQNSKQPYGLVMSDSLMLPGHIKKLTNQITYWWTGSQIKMIPTFSTNSFILNISSTNFATNLTVLGAMTFIFHFCALVSLISISQIRDFIKFVLIVVSKVSKIYLQLIYSSFNAFVRVAESIVTNSNKKTPNPLLLTGLSLNLAKTKRYYQYKGFNTKLSNQEFPNSPSLKSGQRPELNKFKWDPNFKNLSFANKNQKVTYSLLVTLVKKFMTSPTLISQKYETVNNSVFKSGHSPFKLFKSVYSIMIYSAINALIFSFSNLSFLTYSYFLKSLNLVESCVRAIYTFFEKPGELIIDWMAYFFLVEWSSDLTNTIPDTVDTTVSTSFTKLSRSPARMELPVFQSINWLFPPLLNTISFNSPFVYSSVLMPTAHFQKSLEQMTLGNVGILPSFSSSFLGVFSFLSGGLIQRRILSMYDIFVTIACRPDTDLITRQQKGYVFWDLWSDLLIGVAEDSNINVSELSNLKEEQNRLLEKLLSSPTSRVSHSLSNSIYDIGVMYSISNKKSKKMNKLINSFEFNRITSSPLLFKVWALPTLVPSQSLIGKVKGTPEIPKMFFTKFFKKEPDSLSISSVALDLSDNNLIFSNHQTNGNLNKVRKINQKSLSKAISWSTSQFLSYQGKDTELFIDLHPPKSFQQLTSIKYSFSLNQPIGLVLCQIYSGLFYKQIAKNLLVVGPPGSEKSMLIQAIAGETELKIITDNAHRYALVFRGVAVGIKLLRDVFEALTLHTPCLFLLEDIHAIGERRPFLISDDENAKGIESSIYQDREEIHEKNQVAYQLTKHIISHYKKPYKGDFSLLIPTNHFCFDLFNSAAQNVQRTRAANLTAGSPLSVNTKTNGSEKNTMADNQKTSGNSKKAKYSSLSDNSTSLASALQLPKNQLLAPPATSPFSVLVLKEEKKLKPKKIVKEFPWAGLPGEQYANVSKATYSIRVKVALLADMVLSNLSVKLDMITDLLVIIDSVKGNRGFVVFATTHVPYILDPALRRPGRFDETLSLPQIPNLLSRWYISKSNISLWQYNQSSKSSLFSKGKNQKLTISSLNYGEPFSIYPIGVSFSLWETNTAKFLAPFKGGDNTHSLYSSTQNWHTTYLTKIQKSVGLNLGLNNTLVSPPKVSSLNQLKTPRNVSLSNILYPKTGESRKMELVNPVLNLTDFSFQKNKRKNLLFLNQTNFHSLQFGESGLRNKTKLSKSTFSFPTRRGQESKNSFKKQTILTMKVYNIVSRLLISLQQSTVQLSPLQGNKKQVIEANLFTQNKVKNWGDFSFNLRMASMPSNSFLGSCAYKALSKDSLIYTSLYSAPHIFKQHLTVLMAGQIGYTIAKGNLLGSNHRGVKPFSTINGNTLPWDTFLRNASNLAPQGVINLTTDKTWRTATSLVFSFIQKRWIYQRHLVIPRLLDFGLEGSKPEIPSPPSSNILLPAKRYENYRRTFNYSQLKHKTNSSISEKIQFHQQQRLIKRLYKIPLKEFFRSEILNNHINDTKLAINENQSFSTSNSFNKLTSFSNASIMLAPLENYQQKPTSTNWYFRNRLLNRHRTYLSNQWWNGQLREHNPESTFLSDIDWRYTIKSTKEGGIGDLFIDFPDAEQYYNPKNQRWINSSGSWNSWFDFDKSSYDLYSSHYIFECLTNAYKTLDQNRELLDYYVVSLLEKGLGTNNELNEIEILELFKNRF